MASASTLPMAVDRANRNGFYEVKDPGASGTISYSGKGRARCVVVTAAAESRALPSAASQGVGNTLEVLLKTAVGVLTITGAASPVVLSAAGGVAVFEVVLSGTTRVWRSLLAAGTAGSRAVTAVNITTNPLTAASVIGGTITSAPAGAISLTWPTAANLAAALPNGAAQSGDSVDLVVTVTTAQVVTFLTNTGVTLTGASPAITGTTVGVSRLFRLTFTSASAYTVS